MSFAYFRTQVEQLFDTIFKPAYPGVPISYQNFSVKTDENPWIKITIFNDFTERIDIGCDLYRTTGFITVQVFNTANKGTQFADEIADFIADMFVAADIQGINFYDTNHAPVGKEGGFYQSTVDTSFEYDAFR